MSEPKPCSVYCPFKACLVCPWKGGAETQNTLNLEKEQNDENISPATR